ncbi:hypothetical protein WJX74_003713 [Apatococcus lobatus]|uniref:60S ribosomal protein L29 n=1 Tax=Apatococcus lobatus TaxID=904363 RepID=A0AAW1Q7H5_9CHLO
MCAGFPWTSKAASAGLARRSSLSTTLFAVACVIGCCLAARPEKPKAFRYSPNKGRDPKFLRNQRYAKKKDPNQTTK